ncbi:MAG: MarR family transcriptional regulator [Acidimicrobiia bacterium]|nr:MarR family transcriptional regulator [Acidimicrobiia bacterium]
MGKLELEQLSTSLHRLGRLLASRQISSRITTAAGVEVTQQGTTLLRVLLREGQQSMNALAVAAGMDLGAVSRQVRLLEEAGAVTRASDPEDGRVALLRLTAEGRRIAERIRSVGMRHLEDALGEWSDADERRLAELLGRFVDDLMATPVPARAPRGGARRTNAS